jgi:hypothetical protein
VRKVLMPVLVALTVAAGAALAVATPAHAETTRMNYRTPAELATVCERVEDGRSLCVHRHVTCFASTTSCIYVYVWMVPRGRDLRWEDFVLEDATSPPPPPRPGYALVVNVAILTSR